MNIYVWGTGRALGNLLDFHMSLDVITGFVDNDAAKLSHLGKPVIRPEGLLQRSYDAVVVACSAAAEIEAQCRELGIDSQKMIYCFNGVDFRDRNTDYALMERVLGAEYTQIIRSRYHLIPTVEIEELDGKNQFRESGLYRDDYVRTKTLELITEEIRRNRIEGNLAELGVFRGEFAALLNSSLPDRKLYLFDTFSGVETDEAAEEMGKHNCNAAFVEAFKRTSIQTVLEKMTAPEQVILRPGIFPETAAGVEEHFALVSIDVDFEQSTLAGLEFFYPRLSPGGYLLIHDYNSRLAGVAEAVARFERKLGRNVAKVPLCDRSGTCVITR